MKLALLMSNGETVALASRLIAVGASACTAQKDAPLPSCDWLLFDESTLIASKEDRNEAKRLLTEALSLGRPAFAFLSPSAPATPKCALTVTEALAFCSAAAATPSGASDVLGLDGEYENDTKIAETFGDDAVLSRTAALARDILTAHELSFSLVFDPDEGRGVLFAGDAYDTIAAESLEGAVAELFRSAE